MKIKNMVIFLGIRSFKVALFVILQVGKKKFALLPTIQVITLTLTLIRCGGYL